MPVERVAHGRIDAASKAEAPREARERLEFSPGFINANGLPVVGYYFAKDAWERADAWDAVIASDPTYKKAERNPYRKAHTIHFWIWWRYV